MIGLLTYKQGNNTTIGLIVSIKLKYEILISQFETDWIPTSLETEVIDMHPDNSWSAKTHAGCNPKDKKTILDLYTNNWILAHIGVRGYTARSNGVLLKDHLYKNATINNNAATSYPSDLAALTDQIISYADPSSKKQTNATSCDHREQDDKDIDTRDQSKDNDQDGTQFAQTESEETPGDVNTTLAQLLLTGYRTQDDSNLYRSPHFIWAGEVWEEASSNSNDNDVLVDEDLNPDNEANYHLQLPADRHALERIYLVWNFWNTYSTVCILSNHDEKLLLIQIGVEYKLVLITIMCYMTRDVTLSV